jgi:ABC-type nitrate/sulfonate/bicarbonate transport system substrate-binding protein
MKNRSSNLILFLILACAISSSFCKKNTDSDFIVRAAYVPAGYYLPFLVMESEGLLEKRGYALRLTKFMDNAEMVSLLLNDQLDITAQSSITIFPIEADNPGLIKFIYGQYLHSYYFVVNSRSQIKTLSDLRNMKFKIGTWKSPTADTLIRLVFNRAGFNENDYEIKKYNATDWPAMLENGLVDIAFGFDTGVARLIENGAYRVVEKDALRNLLEGELFNGGGFIRSKLLTTNPQKAEIIRQALYEAIKIIKENPERIRAIVIEKLKAPERITDLVSFDDFQYLNENLYDAAEKTYSMLKNSGILMSKINIRAMFWKP